MLLQKLITSSALVEDPSPVASTSRSLILGETNGLLTYKATTRLISLSNCHFSNWDIDSHLIFLLKVCWLSMLFSSLRLSLVWFMIADCSRLLIVQCKITDCWLFNVKFHHRKEVFFPCLLHFYHLTRCALKWDTPEIYLWISHHTFHPSFFHILGSLVSYIIWKSVSFCLCILTHFPYLLR